MGEKSISIRAEFQYSYMPEAGDGCGSEYKCPHVSQEKFLEAFEMKDIGQCSWHSGYRMAEKIFEIPLQGKLPPASMDIEYIIHGRKGSACFDKKYNPVEITTKLPGGAAPNESHYFLWIEEREEWVCFHEDACHLWEAGTFNQRITGPYSVDKSLEEQINHVLKDAEKIERKFEFSFEKVNPHSIKWLYTLMKHKQKEISPVKDIILINEQWEKWDIASMNEMKLLEFCKPGIQYTAIVNGSLEEISYYRSLFEEFKNHAGFVDWVDKMLFSKMNSQKHSKSS